MTEESKPVRTDIQALRGMAVLMVVLYHTKIGGVESGFLGVDIFFVISGFLITTLVATGINRETFRLSEFYIRRAKRLLPAAYVTFLFTALVAPWFLNQQELRDFAVQLIGAVTFTGNLVLWQQTGYFEGAGDLKPLLHVWSLAIEEQYYFLLPAALLYTKRPHWLLGALLLFLVSLGLCIAGGIFKPIANFYLLPTRAWELIAGSIGALWLMRSKEDFNLKPTKIIELLFVPSIACLLILPFMPAVGVHPGPNALFICAATLVVILKNDKFFNLAAPARLLAGIGNFSYSLYLVHWPIIAFMKNAWFGSNPELPLEMRFFALTLSFSLAYLLYRLVEEPIRKSRIKVSPSLIAKVALSSILLMSITPLFMVQTASEQIALGNARAINAGFSQACDYKANFFPRNECKNKKDPDLLVWGDSYAMHLVPGLTEVWTGGVMQATMSGCGPFIGVTTRRKINGEHDARDQAWAKRCISFNQSVVDFLRVSPFITTVVVSSPFNTNFDSAYEHLILSQDSFVAYSVSEAAAIEGLRLSVATLRKLGKKVVLVAPPPSSGFNIGACLERNLSNKVVFGRPKGCVIDKAEYKSNRVDVTNFLNAISTVADLSIIRLDPWLCKEQTCETLLEGKMIYRDEGHLSIAGSKMFAQHMHLDKLIRELAR